MKHKGPIRLETDRLILRKLEIDDAEEAFKNWTSDDEVSKYVRWSTHKNVEETKEWLRQEEENCKEKSYYTWGIVLKETEELIGCISAIFRQEEGRYEIGYNIMRKYWNNGYTTEALRRVMNYLINDEGIKKFICRHAILNPASGSVMRKVGFRYVEDGESISFDGMKKYRTKIYFLDK